MNPPSTLPVKRPRRESRWLWVVVAAVVLLPILLVGGVAWHFIPSSDTKALRKGLTKSSGIEWQQRIAVNAGSLTFGAIRTGLSFMDLEPEARAALKTVRGVEVGIYDLPSDANAPDAGTVLKTFDSTMSGRSWYRVVGVKDGRDLVTVYMPEKTTSIRKLKCCVVVFTGQQTIVASVRANPEPLIQCLLQRPELRDKMRFLASR